MKRAFIIAVLCLTALTAKSQTIEVLGGSTTRIFIEKTDATDNSLTYGYLEGAFGGTAYAQFIREQKFWKLPIFIHGEYRTTFDGGHTAIAGPSYSLFFDAGSISLGSFYRFDLPDKSHSVQASLCYFADWKWFELYGYNDLWYGGNISFFGEERFHIKLGQHFRIGFILDIAYFDSLTFTPYLGVRYDF